MRIITTFLFLEFYGVDQVKHGESAYPIKAWIEKQFEDAKSKPVGPVGKSSHRDSHSSILRSDIGRQAFNIWKRKTLDLHRESLQVFDDFTNVDPVETRNNQDGPREGLSPTIRLDPENFLT